MSNKTPHTDHSEESPGPERREFHNDVSRMYQGYGPDEMLCGFNAEIARGVMLFLLEENGIGSVPEHEWTEFIGNLGAHTVRPDVVEMPPPLKIGPLTFALECRHRRCWLRVEVSRPYIRVPEDRLRLALPMLTWEQLDERTAVFQIC